jgi:ubiquitin-activating enzyme E1
MVGTKNNQIAESNKKRPLSTNNTSHEEDTCKKLKPNNKMSEEKMEVTATGEVDEKLYSRQLYVMGHEAQRRMMASRVLLIGCSGLGVEVAKNCILAGVSSIQLCDPNPVNSYDLGGNFYLSEEHIGGSQSRASLVQGKLAELNPYVKVSVASNVTSLDVDSLAPLLEDMAVVVITIPLPNQVLVQLDEKCRQSGTCFIYSLTTGVFAQIFCDFGTSFVVSDKDGEQPHQSQVETILNSNPAVVKVLEDQGRHNLETGDVISLARVKGMPGFDESRHYTIKSTGPYTFELQDCDFSNMPTPATQGYITQVKQPTTLSFTSYQQALQNPGELMLSDFAKFDRPPLLHLGYKALSEYWEQNNQSFPSPGDASASQAVVDIAKTLDTDKLLEDDEAKQATLRKLASGSNAVLSPMCAALGGIVGQEVLKACSGKFTPIQGFFYLDAEEALPDEDLPSDEVTVSKTSRYDSQIVVFGKSIQ